MKVKVLKKFRDKHNGKVYKVGEVLDITKKRFDEIQKVGKLVEEVKESTEVEEVSQLAEVEEEKSK